MKITVNSVIFDKEEMCICGVIAAILLIVSVWCSVSYWNYKIKIAVADMEHCVEWEAHINRLYSKGIGPLEAQEKMEQQCKDIHPIKYTYKVR